MISVPELVSLPHEGKPKGALRKLKKAWPGSHTKVVVHDQHVLMYVANAPLLARSELWRDVLQRRGVDLSSVALLEVISEPGDAPELYCVVIEDGRVSAQWLQASFNVKDQVAILTAKQVLCACESVNEVFYGQWCSPLTDIEKEAEALYYLQSKKATWPWLVGGGVGALGLSAMLMWPEPPPPVVTTQAPSPVVVVDPWASYRAVMNESPSASQVFEYVQSLAVIADHLPTDWKPGSLSFTDNQLSLAIKREPLGVVGLFEAWLEQNPTLKPYISHNRQGATVLAPLENDLGEWVNKVPPLEPTLKTVQDVLAIMGIEVKSESISTAGASVASLSLDQTFSLLELEMLMRLLKPIPVTLDYLNLEYVDLGQWQGSIQLKLYGAQS
ncbi:hypothetical protein [Vibrio jasicida]|uniref:hypothetical protein n=1 Tax=Vibrio jasicida TaxID=766224 RepID=UPI0005F0875B|nr:hypothetical protein [Vibrio jasicida]